MKITKQEIKDLHPCRSGWEWYCEKERPVDLEALLIEMDSHNPVDARWLFTKLMNKIQCVKIAVFAAEQVIDLFENKYPDDDRPRHAIELAKVYIKTPDMGSADAAHAAAAAAAAAAHTADAADAAAAAAHAADAAAYVAYTAAAHADAAAYVAYTAAAHAADDAAYVAYTAAAYVAYTDAATDAAAAAAIRIKIIKEAVRILDEQEK